MKQTPSDKSVEKARKYLKDNGLLAVPFDKGVGFCVLKKETYEKKLKDLLQAEQFSERKNLTDSVMMKNEKDISKELLAMKKKDEISKALYTRLRSTGHSWLGCMDKQKYMNKAHHFVPSFLHLVAHMTT